MSNDDIATPIVPRALKVMGELAVCCPHCLGHGEVDAASCQECQLTGIVPNPAIVAELARLWEIERVTFSALQPTVADSGEKYQVLVNCSLCDGSGRKPQWAGDCGACGTTGMASNQQLQDILDDLRETLAELVDPQPRESASKYRCVYCRRITDDGGLTETPPIGDAFCCSRCREKTMKGTT